MAEYRIYVRFMHSHDLAGSMISYFTRAWCSHTELLFGDRTFGAQLDGGLRWRSVNAKCYDNLVRMEVWSFPVTEAQMKATMDLIALHNGDKYAWWQIPAFLLGHVIQSAHEEICSGFLAELMNNACQIWLAFDPSEYTPGNVLQIVMQMPNAQKEK